MLTALQSRAGRPSYRLCAVSSLFETKDLHKARRSHWDGEELCWWKEVVADQCSAAAKPPDPDSSRPSGRDCYSLAPHGAGRSSVNADATIRRAPASAYALHQHAWRPLDPRDVSDRPLLDLHSSWSKVRGKAHKMHLGIAPSVLVTACAMFSSYRLLPRSRPRCKWRCK